MNRTALAFAAALLGSLYLAGTALAVEPFPLKLGTEQPLSVNITRNDGGTFKVNTTHAICIDSDTSAKVGQALNKVNVSSSTTTAVPTTALVGRRTVSIQNHGPNEIFCCFTAACTPVIDESWAVAAKANGLPGQQTFDMNDAMPVRCKARTADQVNGGSTIVLELQ